jgi:hypothetical protein
MIYHVMGELDYLNRKSKMIPPIWALKEIRHLAEASEEPTIIQTDHANSWHCKANQHVYSVHLRLIEASQQFRLESYPYDPGCLQNVQSKPPC